MKKSHVNVVSKEQVSNDRGLKYRGLNFLQTMFNTKWAADLLMRNKRTHLLLCSTCRNIKILN